MKEDLSKILFSDDELITLMRMYEKDHIPDGWPAVQMKNISRLLDMIDKFKEENEGEWYVVDHFHDDFKLRGPYKHREAAGAVRHEMETHASDAQNERWNLWIQKGE